jgi:peptidase inhibitor family I36
MTLKMRLAALGLTLAVAFAVAVGAAGAASACNIGDRYCIYENANYGGGFARFGSTVPYYPLYNFDNGRNINDRVTSIKNRWILGSRYYVNAFYDGDSLGVDGGRFIPNLDSFFNDKFSSHAF